MILDQSPISGVNRDWHHASGEISSAGFKWTVVVWTSVLGGDLAARGGKKHAVAEEMRRNGCHRILILLEPIGSQGMKGNGN
jgi:hypothetical protein